MKLEIITKEIRDVPEGESVKISWDENIVCTVRPLKEEVPIYQVQTRPTEMTEQEKGKLSQIEKSVFRYKLKRYRERKKLTQTKLAERLGVSLATLNSWEHGRNYPRKKNLEKIEKLKGWE